jgi:hypothetical protein
MKLPAAQVRWFNGCIRLLTAQRPRPVGSPEPTWWVPAATGELCASCVGPLARTGRPAARPGPELRAVGS